jgi:hypothetical protein
MLTTQISMAHCSAFVKFSRASNFCRSGESSVKIYLVEGLSGMLLPGKTEVIQENPVPVPLCLPKFSHGLAWDGVRSSAVSGRRLTAWAVAYNFED